MHPRHQFVRAATTINNGTSISVVTVQSIVATGSCDPDNRVVGPIRRSDEGRPAPVADRLPSDVNSRWTGWSNAESPEFVASGAQGNVRALISSVRRRCLNNNGEGFLRCCQRLRPKTTKVIAIE
jgi:hypothetical protein